MRPLGIERISVVCGRGHTRESVAPAAEIAAGETGRGLGEHLAEGLAELVVLVAVDDKVEGGVDGGQQVGEGDHGVHPVVPVALHVHACRRMRTCQYLELHFFMRVQ